MNLNGYDAWKTTEPFDYEPDAEPDPFELDEVTEEWNDMWEFWTWQSPLHERRSYRLNNAA
jgi:hypothetical protein